MPANVVWWVAVLIVLLLAGFVAVSLAKKRLLQEDDNATPTGFTLADLRVLHREGRMSDQEFEKAKLAMVAAIRRADARKVTDKNPASREGQDQLLP
jgi:hypothetical protein